MQKQLREIEKFSDKDQMFWDGQKEQWKEKQQEIEQKRNELLPEHQKMQKRSQKMQSLQDKQRIFLKDACACDEEMRKVEVEINERETRCLELAETSNGRMAAEDLEEELRSLQAGEERRDSCASQSKGCCFDPVLEQLFTLGRRMRDSRSNTSRKNSSEGSRSQSPLCTWQEKKRKEESGKRSKRKEQPVAKFVHKRQVGAMKAFRLVLFLILLGTRTQTVNAVEDEISVRQEMDRRLEKVPVPRADSGKRWRRVDTCESQCTERGRGLAREKKQKQPGWKPENPKWKQPEPLKKTGEGREHL